MLAFDSTAREIVRRIGRDSSVVVADVARSVHGRPAFADFLHFTDAGASAVAGVLSRTIIPQINVQCLMRATGKPE
jgi:hypothetical protein